MTWSVKEPGPPFAGNPRGGGGDQRGDSVTTPPAVSMFTLKWFRKSRPRRPSASLKSISWATTTRGPALASPTSMDCTRTMSTLVVPVAPRLSARGANHVEIPRRQSARGLITVVSAPVSSMSVTGPPPLTLALTRMGFPGWKGIFVTPDGGPSFRPSGAGGGVGSAIGLAVVRKRSGTQSSPSQKWTRPWSSIQRTITIRRGRSHPTGSASRLLGLLRLAGLLGWLLLSLGLFGRGRRRRRRRGLGKLDGLGGLAVLGGDTVQPFGVVDLTLLVHPAIGLGQRHGGGKQHPQETQGQEAGTRASHTPILSQRPGFVDMEPASGPSGSRASRRPPSRRPRPPCCAGASRGTRGRTGRSAQPGGKTTPERGSGSRDRPARGT